MKILILLLSLIGAISITIALVTLLSIDTANQTKRLCREYADRDHEMELAPARWKWFKDQGIDLNRDFDWYGSCLKHNSNQLTK